MWACPANRKIASIIHKGLLSKARVVEAPVARMPPQQGVRLSAHAEEHAVLELHELLPVSSGRWSPWKQKACKAEEDASTACSAVRARHLLAARHHMPCASCAKPS